MSWVTNWLNALIPLTALLVTVFIIVTAVTKYYEKKWEKMWKGKTMKWKVIESKKKSMQKGGLK